MKYIRIMAASVLSISSLSVYAATNHYTIFVDAGSTSSKLHIFSYDDSAALPNVSDVFSESVKPGISSFVDHPELVGPSLKKLLDDAAQYIQKNGADIHTVPVNVYATAGMRLVEQKDKQQAVAIYDNISQYLKTNYTFASIDAKTIPGQMEGLYGWLDVNYLAGHFQHHEPTVGSIDMGGASTQIAYDVSGQYSNAGDSTIPMTINNQKYTVFSQSFLGLGQDQAIGSMIVDVAANACYPKDYEFKSGGMGDFNFAGCQNIYTNIIQKHHVAEQILPIKGQSFIVYSGIFYTLHFFNVDQTPDQAVVESTIKTVCAESWGQLQKEHPTDKYLTNYCANGVYENQLLYSTYGLQGDLLTVESQINGKDIDWTLGAAVYSLLK